VDNGIITALITLSAIGIAAAVILYFIAQKFKVIEDPRIDDVNEALPQANCGGCGFAGCRAFAEAMVKEGTMEGFFCPVGGNDLMKSIAPLLGVEAVEKKPQIAVLRCNGSPANSPAKYNYDGPVNCTFTHTLAAGEGGCQFGCLGGGECVDACDFDAMYMDPETNLPVVKDNCVACGACVAACPRDLLELRNRGPKERRIFVACRNMEKGGPAKKNCSVACIGCSACFKVCAFDAITMANNLAYIDYEKCTLCRKCVEVCPTNAIHEINFKPRKPKPPKDDKKPAVKKAVKTEDKVDLAAMAKAKEEKAAVKEEKTGTASKENDNNNNK
jgi:Na+-translocating ferredoxin:NAD+ oxidoreductase RNF subunit RnfB